MRKLFLISILFVSSRCFSQIKLSLDSSKLVNGNGLEYIRNVEGKNFGFRTYRNGHVDGKFYRIDTARVSALSGNLKYRPSCMNYLPGVKVTFQSENDTITGVFDSALFKLLFVDTANIIETHFALAPEMNTAGVHPDLNTWLSDDPAVVPIGRWQLWDLKRKYILEQFDFDDCGNTLMVTYFNPDGSIFNQKKFKPESSMKKNWFQRLKH